VDAATNFECKPVEKYKPGDCPLPIGEIIAAHVNQNSNVKKLYVLGKDTNWVPLP
jgi:flavin reductase (DIM6/NTAB) family NADH-FMN oxidoreductase RutF